MLCTGMTPTQHKRIANVTAALEKLSKGKSQQDRDITLVRVKRNLWNMRENFELLNKANSSNDSSYDNDDIQSLVDNIREQAEKVVRELSTF